MHERASQEDERKARRLSGPTCVRCCSSAMIDAEFLGEDFDPKQWLNIQLKESDPSNLPALEEELAILAAKLQLLGEEVGRSLDEDIEGATALVLSIPDDLSGFEAKIEEVQSKISKALVEVREINLKAESPVSVVRTCDTVLGRIESCRRILEDSEKWNNLVNGLDELFEQKDYRKIALRLKELEMTLSAVTNEQEAGSRSTIVASAASRLELLLLPELNAALSEHNLAKTKELYNVFGRLGRTDSFESQFRASRLKDPLEQWQSLEFSGGSERFIDRMVVLLGELKTYFMNEKRWCAQFFPKPEFLTLSLIRSYIATIQPSLHQRLTSVFWLDNEQDLSRLVLLFSLFDEFQRWIATEIFPPSCSISDVQFVTGAFDIFRNEYVKYEEALFSMLPRLDIHDIFAALENCKAEFSGHISRANRALKRCLDFTHGQQIIGVLHVLERYFSTIVTHLAGLISKEKGPTQDLLPKAKIDPRNSPFVADATDLNALFEVLEFPSVLYEQWNVFAVNARDAILIIPVEDVGSDVKELIAECRESSSVRRFDVVRLQFAVLAKACQQLLYANLLVPVMEQLAGVPGRKEWSLQATSQPSLLAKSFSMSPLPYITRIGEHLLLLPQLLEPLGHKQAYDFFLDCLPHNAAVESLLSKDSPGDVAASPQDDAEDSLSPVTRRWIASVTAGAMMEVERTIKDIPHLTLLGSRQLAADIQYFLNILAALGLQPSSSLVLLQKLLEMNESEIASARKLHSDQADLTVFDDVARIRRIRWNPPL